MIPSNRSKDRFLLPMVPMGIYTIPEICDRQVARQPFLLQGRSSASYPSEFVEFLSLANQS